MRLSEYESNTHSNVPQSAKSSISTTPLDVLSSDYADMTLGNSMRNIGPTLSPKENIKKLKSSFFACNTIDENKMDYTTSNATTQPNPPATINSKNSIATDAGDYAIMNPFIVRRIVAQQPPLNSTPNMQTSYPVSTKKTVLVTSNNNPDKVLANTQSKTNIDGFKPISSHADKEVYMQNAKMVPINASFSRQHSAPVEKQRKPSNDNGGYELLELRSSSSAHAVNVGGRIARPNSVNSEKTTFTPLMRPNSANSCERQSTSTYSLTSTPLDQSAATSVNILLLSIWSKFTNILFLNIIFIQSNRYVPHHRRYVAVVP